MRAIFPLVLLVIGGVIHADEISSMDYPRVSARIDFFNQRMNSKDAEVRLSALRLITGFHYEPSDEFVKLLRQMTLDQDARIRGHAVKTLHDLYVPVDVLRLPQPIGHHGGSGRDLSTEATEALIMRELEAGVASGGATYFAGLLGSRKFVPLLIKNGESLRDDYPLCCVARALLDCGEVAEAVKLWRRAIELQVHAYTEKGLGRTSPYYYIEACRGLIHSGEAFRLEGIERLAVAIGHLDAAEDPDSASKLDYARESFMIATGAWVESGEIARKHVELMKQKADTSGGGKPPK
jgi:hypothetical protein